MAELKRAAALWPAGRWSEQQQQHRLGRHSSFRLQWRGRLKDAASEPSISIPLPTTTTSPSPPTSPHRRSFREDALAAADAVT